MPDDIFNIRDFSKRLWLSGGRDVVPAGGMRRCVGSSPDPEVIIKSRWGSKTRFAIPNINSIACPHTPHHYLSDGFTLYADSTPIDTGYNGARMTFMRTAPAIGITPYLFVCGAGKIRKIDNANNITNWGIEKPSAGMIVTPVGADTINIDKFDVPSNPTAHWTPTNCTLTQSTTIDMDIHPTTGVWSIVKTLGSPLNLQVYGDGTISLQTDLIHCTFQFEAPQDIVWVQFDFDVSDGTFSTDYYSALVNITGTGSTLNVSAQVGEFLTIAVPKSSFTRTGTNLIKDWDTVVAIRVQGGNTTTNPPALHIADLEVFGGAPLGTGTFATSGGATFKYLATFGSSKTGNQSNPNDVAAVAQGITLEVNLLTFIPISLDPQVDFRDLYRTSENGGTFFYLDTIYDNVTTGYSDRISSVPGIPIVTTPWASNATVATNKYIDGGNGYYFQATTGGTTGLTVPLWILPTADWVALGVFPDIGDVIVPDLNYRQHVISNAFKLVVPGTSGAIQPKWAVIAVGNTVVDGTAVWQNIGPLVTIDNTVTWQCIGINEVPSLGTQQVEYDNIPFPATIGDAVAYQGAVVATRDGGPGAQGYVYVSTPGKAEGYANILQVGTQDDPCQKLIVWNEQLYVMTTRYIYPLTGAPPGLAQADKVTGAEGTSWPFTVVETPYGIAYRAASGIRLFNNVTSDLIGYQAIAPIETGRTVENVTPFYPIIGEHCRNELLFSDGAQTFGYNFTDGTWRVLGVGANALYYHDEIDVIHFARPASVVDWESPGVLTDDGAPIPIEWQPGSVLQDVTQVATSKRIWLDVDLGGNTLVVALLVDQTAFALPLITGSGRQTIVIPFQAPGRIFGVRLSGNVITPVVWHGVWGEGHHGR